METVVVEGSQANSGVQIQIEQAQHNDNDVVGSSNALTLTPTRKVAFQPRRKPRLLAKAGEGSKNNGVVEGQGEVTVAVEPPAAGMVFDTFMDVERYYKSYAQQQGFAVTRTQGGYNARKERRATTWRCECWGDPEMKSVRKSKKRAKEMEVCGNVDDDEDEGVVKRRNTKKCFCTAMVYASLNDDRKWVIRKVILDHLNHTPCPFMVVLVKEYRMQHFNRSVRRRLINDAHVGVSVSQIHSALVYERGGYENMPLTEKDMRHELDKNKKLKMVGGDSNALIAYFDKMHEDNPNFFHTHRLDEQGIMKDVLWVDARSRAAYEEFSDVVCFDTTYLTNEYTLPFVNFVGVNHHGQSILFGCALISHEDCDTFEWVFTKWLMCMNGKQPGGILTDQAAAMRRPLRDVMPDTRHRWCIWHILQKLSSKVGPIEGAKEFKDELLDVIYNSLNTDEFETGWARVVNGYGLQENEWLTNLFVERHMWVPCFMTDHFWAGMRTTQRVESINSFFDKFINRHTMLCEFGEKYIAAVEKRINDEKTADSKSKKWVRNYATRYNVERFFRNLYTNNKFLLVQKECRKITHVDVIEEKHGDGPDETKFEYLLEDRVWVLPKGCAKEIVTTRRTYYRVWFDAVTQEAMCACKMFETHGIMCRHLIRVYDRNRIENIPQKYVLRRWRKDITRKHSSKSVSHHDQNKTVRSKRLDKLCILYEPVTDLAVSSDKLVGIVERTLKSLETELLTAIAEVENSGSHAQSESLGGSSGPSLSASCVHRSTTSPGLNSACSETGAQAVGDTVTANQIPTSSQPKMYNIKDPPLPKKRGRPQTTRFKSAAERGSKGKGKGKKASKGTEVKDKSQTPDISVGCISSDAASLQQGKMQVKRKRKSVSFAEIMPESQPVCDLSADDDLLQRNMLTYA